nr:RNA polymerase sigma factor [Acetobacter persici]
MSVKEVMLREVERRVAHAIPSLRRYARTLTNNHSDADDLVQECLEKAWPKLETVEDRDDLRPWLLKILHNLNVSRWRKLRRLISFDYTRDERSDAPTQEVSVECRQMLEALGQLPEHHRQVLVLIGIEDLSYSAVASIMDVPLGTVMSRLSRARTQLRAQMEKDTVGSPVIPMKKIR